MEGQETCHKRILKAGINCAHRNIKDNVFIYLHNTSNTPSYANIKIPNTSPAHKHTQGKVAILCTDLLIITPSQFLQLL